MQQTLKNRLSAKISALLVAILTLSSLPLANNAKAVVVSDIQFSATAATATEGNTLMLTITSEAQGNPSNSTANISYAISGTANTSQDFVFNNAPSVTAGAIAFSGTNLQIPLTLVDDGDDAEGQETVIVTITDVQGSHVQLGANTTFTVTINDNTGSPFINFTSETSGGLEDQAGILTVQLSRASAQDVTFQWSADYPATTAQSIETVLGGNTFPADFANAPIAPIDVTILAGQLTATIDLGIQNDNLYELTETIEAGITGNITGAQFGTALNHTYIIYDNDTPSIQFTAAEASGDESAGTHQLTVSLSNPSYLDTEVTVETNGASTAQAGDLSVDGIDWNLPNSMRMIPAGQTSLPVTITIKDDTESEGNETAILTIPSAPQEVTLGATLSYTYTIIDNDTPAASGSYGTAIPQSTASVGGVPAGSVVVTPVVTAPTPVVTSPVPATSVESTSPTSGQVLGEQINVLHELITKLKFGSTNDEVKQLQTELQKLGFFPAKMNTTRYYGVITRASIEKYLNTKFEGISVQDLAKMLKFGQRNNAVKKLQNELKAAGFFPMNQTATGFYGNITKQAVANYLAR
jgi:hypothetical protein